MVDYEQRILDAVDARRDEIISFVQKMIQIPSVTLDEVAIGNAFYEGMQKLGLQEVQLIEEEPGHPNIIARVKGDAGGPSLVFNGHLDVIPPGPEEDWTYPSTSRQDHRRQDVRPGDDRYEIRYQRFRFGGGHR